MAARSCAPNFFVPVFLVPSLCVTMPRYSKRNKTSAGSSGGGDSDSCAYDDVFRDVNQETKKVINFFENKFHSFKNEVEQLLASKEEVIAKLEQKIAFLERSVAAIDERCDDAEAYERRDTVIISGSELPTATDQENPAEVVCETLKNKIGVIVQPTDISVAHRQGKKPASQTPDKRGIIVKLCRRETKHNLMATCKRVKPSNLYINDSLTPTRNTILYGLRQAKKRLPGKISGCGSVDGRVFVWLKPPNPDTAGARSSKIFCNTKSKFETLCAEKLNFDSSQLVSSWPNNNFY